LSSLSDQSARRRLGFPAGAAFFAPSSELIAGGGHFSLDIVSGTVV
jgi:hypothetical protein